MNSYLESKTPQPDIFLGDLERRAFEQNIMFALYNDVKDRFGVRPDLETLNQVITDGSATVNGVQMTIDDDSAQPRVNNQAIPVTPLFEGLSNSTDFDYNKQRKAYLVETLASQKMFINFDSKSTTDAFGKEQGSSFNIKKAQDALKELAPDTEQINPKGFFKTDMTAAQKIRFMSKHIDTLKADIKRSSHKLTGLEKEQIEKPLVDAQIQQALADMMSGAVSVVEATKREKTHKIDEQHNYFKTTLQGIEGLNDTKNFAVSHLKPMPLGYVTHKEQLSKALEVDYSDSDSTLKIIGKQLSAFMDAKELLAHPPSVDFSNGTDLDRLFIPTYTLAGNAISPSKSCVVDASESYNNVSAGDFALPKTSLVNKPFSSYKAIAVTVGASAAGAITTALKSKDDVLVIDALEDTNVGDILAKIREGHKIGIAVFTDNPQIDDFIKQSGDRNLSTNLSHGIKWGEAGINAINEGSFDRFERLVNDRVSATLDQHLSEESSFKPAIIQDLVKSEDLTSTVQANQNNHHYQRVGL